MGAGYSHLALIPDHRLITLKSNTITAEVQLKTVTLGILNPYTTSQHIYCIYIYIGVWWT